MNAELNTIKATDRVVLLLTQAYTPINVTMARRGIYMLYRCLQHSQPSVFAISKTGERLGWNEWVNQDPELFYDEQPYINTAKESLPVPTILLTTGKFFYRGGVSKIPRIRVLYEYYKGKCQICGEHKHIKDMSIEHINPKSKGGTNDSFNVTMSCKTCNSVKGDIYPYFNWAGKELEGYKPPIVPDIKLARKEWADYAFKG